MKIKVFATILVVVIVILSIKNWKWMHTSKLRVGFPVSYIIQNKTLLNPANLESTQEYYLLENLSATMLRYSEDASSNFVGYLAESWFVSGNKVFFRLKDNLRWSDGAPISCDEIVNHFTGIISNPHRHLQAFKRIIEVSCKEDESIIVFHFTSKPPGTFFHELTLADTGLIKPLLDKTSWQISSGPYFVSKIDSERKQILLKKNLYAPLSFGINTPDEVLLREIPFDLKSPFDPNDEDGIDYASPQGWSFLPKVSKLIDAAPMKKEGQPSLVHFISFIKAKEKVRSALAFVANKTNLNAELLPKNTRIYNELIPPGYNGYLNLGVAAIGQHVEPLNDHVTLIAREQYAGLRPWLDRFKLEAAQIGLDVEVEFGDVADPSLIKKDGNIAVLGVFKGNLKDPVGSWSFLSDKKHGLLRGYSSLVESFLDRAMSAEDDQSKNLILSDLHKTVLNQYILIPLWCENVFMLHNKNISNINSNPFDFRIHFYEIMMN